MHHEFFKLAKKISESQSDSKYALATILSVKGSAYRREGTRMIIGSNGKWFGNISGGCLEGDILRKAAKVIESSEPLIVTYDTRESENKELRVALGCNGVIDILIEPVTDSVISWSNTITDLFEREKTIFISTKIILNENKISIIRSSSEDEPALIPTGTFENESQCFVEKSENQIILHEFVGLQRKMVIWGSGPDVLPIARFSIQMGWKTVVVSDTGTISSVADLENITIIKSYPDEFLDKVSVHENTAVILVSHDYYKDYFVFERIVKENVKYIGIMGPKRRGARMIDEYRASDQGNLNESNIHYPVGLDIGSDNPTEIALSIISEVQAVFSGKNAGALKDKTNRIHDRNPDEQIEEFNPGDSVCTINQIQ